MTALFRRAVEHDVTQLDGLHRGAVLRCGHGDHRRDDLLRPPR
jgi:hypothetical protein